LGWFFSLINPSKTNVEVFMSDQLSDERCADQSNNSASEAAGRDEEPLPNAPAGFEVRDHSSANWLVRKIVEARLYRRRVQEWAIGETRRAEREEQFFLQRYGPQLEAWAREQITNSSRKSLKLPAGTVGFRTEPGRLEIKDESRLISWCRRVLPNALRTNICILKSLVSDHLQQTGECPDGADVSGGGERFFVK
jgi:Bacteriophage Mu Gam like protein